MLKQSSSFYLPSFCLRWGICTLMVFGLALLLIRAQPYTYATNPPFLAKGCSAACFAGVQPGVTSVEDAVKLLQASKWVGEVDNRTINNVSGYISWTWSDQKPDWINANQEGEIWASQKQVVQIMIYGDMQLGDTRLVLGSPDQEIIDRSADRKGQFSLYTAFYSQAGLMIQSWQPCNAEEPLRRPVILTYTLQSDPNTFLEQDSLADLKHTCPFSRP
jgi:hypothetical protein